MKRVRAANLVFRAPEVRQHVIERPAGIAELPPVVEVLGLTTDINHAIYRRRPAQHLAAGPEDAPIAGPRVGFGLVAPVDRQVGKSLAKAERDMDPAIAV